MKRGARSAPITIVLIVLLGFVVVATRPAPARAEDARSAARRKLAEGTALLRHGDYPTALERFQAAHDLIPSPQIEYSVGLAYMRMGRNADALAAFDSYLGQTIFDSATNLNKARAYREDVARKVARVGVTADLDGAAIAIDGRLYGTTPRPAEIVVDAGAHLLTVEPADDARTFARQFVVPPGGSLVIDAKLQTGATGGAADCRPSECLPLDSAPTPAAEVRARDVPRWLKPAALYGSGVAVAALGFGVYEWVVSQRRYSSFNERGCSVGYPDAGGPGCSQLVSDGDHAKRLGIVGLAAGATLGAAAAGAWIWMTTHETPATRERALACAPTVAGGACRLLF